MNRRLFLWAGPIAVVLAVTNQRKLTAQENACIAATPGIGGVVASFTSTGDAVSPPFDLRGGTYVVRANNTVRDSYFSVHLLPLPGTGEPFEDKIITYGSEFGAGGERSWAETAEAGRYVLTVEGEGDWTVSVEQ